MKFQASHAGSVSENFPMKREEGEREWERVRGREKWWEVLRHIVKRSRWRDVPSWARIPRAMPNELPATSTASSPYSIHDYSNPDSREQTEGWDSVDREIAKLNLYWHEQTREKLAAAIVLYLDDCFNNVQPATIQLSADGEKRLTENNTRQTKTKYSIYIQLR